MTRRKPCCSPVRPSASILSFCRGREAEKPPMTWISQCQPHSDSPWLYCPAGSCVRSCPTRSWTASVSSTLPGSCLARSSASAEVNQLCAGEPRPCCLPGFFQPQALKKCIQVTGFLPHLHIGDLRGHSCLLCSGAENGPAEITVQSMLDGQVFLNSLRLGPWAVKQSGRKLPDTCAHVSSQHWLTPGLLAPFA